MAIVRSSSRISAPGKVIRKTPAMQSGGGERATGTRDWADRSAAGQSDGLLPVRQPALGRGTSRRIVEIIEAPCVQTYDRHVGQVCSEHLAHAARA